MLFITRVRDHPRHVLECCVFVTAGIEIPGDICMTLSELKWPSHATGFQDIVLCLKELKVEMEADGLPPQPDGLV